MLLKKSNRPSPRYQDAVSPVVHREAVFSDEVRRETVAELFNAAKTEAGRSVETAFKAEAVGLLSHGAA